MGVGKRHVTKPGDSLDFSDIVLCRSNVILLDAFRSRRGGAASHSIFYITEDGIWTDLLGSIAGVRAWDIREVEELRTALVRSRPDLILIESKLSWADPLDLIEKLSFLLTAPVVLLCDKPSNSKRSGQFLRQAYAAGVHDTLFAPLQRDDLEATIRVLLKLTASV